MPIPHSSTEEAVQEPHVYGAAVSFDDFKAALGDTAAKYTDAQIDDLRLACDRLADIYFDDWLRKQNATSVSEAIDV